MKIYRQQSNNAIRVKVTATDINIDNAIAVLTDYAKDATYSTWYNDAHAWAVSVAKQYNVSLQIVCDLTGLLSPLTEWNVNKRRVERVLAAWQNGEKISVSFAKTMEHVYNCLEGKPYNLGPKTGAFSKAILDPDNPDNLVVIDSLAMQIILGIGDIPASVTFKETCLVKAQQVYIAVAKLYNVSPVALQAATWQKANTRRKTNRNVLPTVLDSFDTDSLDISVEKLLNIVGQS